ncbi:AAA family ATPase, partial [Lysinibacillus sp. NPDC056232]|uniref:AAA family ATPase n=1 Tax=Lysinibacillus sp. NPDC056232 TaxID=3345756 RepID=UPI0035D60991
MIKKISMQNIATYDEIGATLDNVKKINFIYGNNGSGKTTISEFIRKEEKFPHCILEWQGKRLVPYVYNRNFVNENFRLDNPIKGIFTLGKESVNLQLQIDELKEKIISHDDEIRKQDNLIGTKNDELSKLNEEFREKCWDIKKELDSEFKDLIEGYRNSKEKFMNKCLEESNNLIQDVKTLDQIRERKESIYDQSGEKLELLININYDECFEDSSIFKVRIIGKEDVDIADLFSKLNISDWVQHGFM